MTDQQIASLKDIGQEWTKNGLHRIYFNDLAGLYGLRCNYYNTGNISAAWLDGSEISNGQARKIADALSYAKVWYDFATENFQGRNIDAAYFNEIIKALRIKAGLVTVAA